MTHAVGAILLLAVFAQAAVDAGAEMNRIKEDLSALLARDRDRGIALLQTKITQGTALEKDAAIYLAEEQVILELIPAMLEAVTDTTPAPRYDDTGWGFIGRHAGWAIGGIIMKVDRRWVERKGAASHLELMGFFNDEDRPRLRRALSAWWNRFRTGGASLR